MDLPADPLEVLSIFTSRHGCKENIFRNLAFLPSFLFTTNFHDSLD